MADVERHKLVEILAYSLRLAAYHSNSAFTGEMVYLNVHTSSETHITPEMVIQYLEFFFYKFRASDPHQAASPRLRTMVQRFEAGTHRALRRIWYPTLSWLRNTHDLRRTSQPTAYTREAGDIWDMAITSWKSVGEYLGFDESDPSIQNPNGYVEGADIAPQLGWSPRRCAWRQCLCYEGSIHRMRICKGCWRTQYCTKRCQKQ